ncbi:MAG: two-component regulator propeller domain-containing protein, partial [Bacteroidota bacterium]
MKIKFPLIIFSLITFSLISQNYPKFYSIGVSQGLSQNSVSCISQDKFGFLWFGTASGLNLYNGFSFKNYQFDNNDTASISESAITSLFSTKKGELLIGTRYGGLNKLNLYTGKVQRYMHNPSSKNTISSNSVNYVIETAKQEVIVATDNGLNFFDGSNFTCYKFNNQNVLRNKVTTLFEDRTAKIWVGGATNALMNFDLKTKTFTEYQDPYFTQKRYTITSIKEFAPGILMLATQTGIKFFDTYSKRYINSIIEYSNTDTLLNNEISSFTKDLFGNIWCGLHLSQSENVLAKINIITKKIEYVRPSYQIKDALQPERILTLFTDISGLVWAGLDGKGISYFNPAPSKFTHLSKGTKPQGLLTNEYVYAIEEDTDGSVWIGTNDYELHRYFPETGQMKYCSTGIINRNWCSDIELSKTGKIWISFRKNEEEGGVILFDEKKNKYQTLDELSGKTNVLGTYLVRTIKEEGDSLWIGTHNEGLFCFNTKSKKITAYKHQNNLLNSIADNEIASIYRDSRKRLWISTRGGLSLYNYANNSFINFKHQSVDKKSLSSNNVLCVLEDTKKNIWICTAHGINVFNEATHSFDLISAKDGLPDNYVYGALEDKKGNLWLSTNNGLCWLDIGTRRVKNFTENDGLQSNEFNTGAWHKGRSGKMYFGGINGLSIFHPDSIKNEKFIPRIVLTSFSILGNEFVLDSTTFSKKHIELDYEQNFIAFDFAALDYLNPERNVLACKLEGFDENWIVLKHTHSISYSNLDPGNYKLLVKASKGDGYWNENVLVITINILPPFYKTIWFYLICCATIIISIRVFYRYRIRKLLKTRRELEQLVQDRTTQLTIQKNELNKSYDNVKILSEIGKKITSTLELNRLCSVIYSELNTILDSKIFAIGILNSKKNEIEFISIMEEGTLKDNTSFVIEKNSSYSGWCIDNGKEIMINDFTVEDKEPHILTANCIAGNKAQSVIYVPILNSRGEAYGVFTVQSFNKFAYSDYHLSLLKNLSVYINIAIDNARAYKSLDEAKKEMEKLSLVASRTDNGVVICDDKGDIEWLNDGFTRLYGYSFEEFIDKYDKNIVKASNSSKITKILKECLETKRTVFYESRAITKDGETIWVQTTLTPILDTEKNIYKLVAIDADITELKKAEEQILIQKLEIETKNKDITDSINYARRIQKATLATKTQLDETFADHFVYFKPKDIVSGDFYWMAKNNERTFLAVADCTGHGVPGAILSVIGTALLDEIIVQQNINSPALALEKMRSEIIRLLNPEGAEEETNDGIDIVLCAISKNNHETEKKITLEFACARNPLIHIRNNSLKEYIPDYFCVG